MGWSSPTAPSSLQPLLVDVDVLESPAHLLARQRLAAELALGDAHRFDVQDPVVDPQVVIAGADPLRVLHVPFAGGEDVFVDLL